MIWNLDFCTQIIYEKRNCVNLFKSALSACLTITLLFIGIAGINAQEPLNKNERTFLVDDINNKRLLDIRQNILQSNTIANLSDEQKAQIDILEDDLQKNLSSLNNQLLSLQKDLKKLEAEDAVKMKSINRNIDEQAKLIAKQMKLKAEQKQKIRKLLTAEQRVEFDKNILNKN